jgi:hypothetical protein
MTLLLILSAVIGGPLAAFAIGVRVGRRCASREAERIVWDFRPLRYEDKLLLAASILHGDSGEGKPATAAGKGKP